MGKSAPTPPPAPDYVGAAQAQGQANLAAGQQTASLSNPNITNPYGSQTVTYQPTGPNGDYQPYINQTLNPNAQQALDAQQRVQAALGQLGLQGVNQASGILGSPFQYSGPNIQTSLGDYGKASAGQQAQGNLDLSGVAKMPVNAGVTGQQALLSRLQPQIDQRDKALQQQLANQGLTPGGEAYTNAMRDQNNANNDLYTQAALQGIGLDMSANQQGYNQALGQAGLYNQAAAQNYSQGLGAQAQNYNEALGAAQFGNTAAQQALAQQLGLYNQPLNQITALMSGSQIQAPQFQQYQGSNIQAAPIANATSQLGQYNQNIYGQQVAAYNAGQQGLGSALGGLAGMFRFNPISW